MKVGRPTRPANAAAHLNAGDAGGEQSGRWMGSWSGLGHDQ
jgi:hypothetical protein